MNVIMRPVFNRVEMLYLSLEYEIAARKYFEISDEFITLFVVEYGSPKETIGLINNYPFAKKIINRKIKSYRG